MLKPEVKMISKGGIYYLLINHRIVRFVPWIGDLLAPVYDSIMSKKIFPEKFNADIRKHYDILKTELSDVRGKKVLDIAAGSGSTAEFLPSDNSYTGTDISSRLLKLAVEKFRGAGFRDCSYFAVSAEDLPFEDAYFDVCLCILALNFFGDITRVFAGISRILVPGGFLLCAVPVPERMRPGVRIHGTLLSESRIAEYAAGAGLGYEPVAAENGALLYFRLVR